MNRFAKKKVKEASISRRGGDGMGWEGRDGMGEMGGEEREEGRGERGGERGGERWDDGKERRERVEDRLDGGG